MASHAARTHSVLSEAARQSDPVEDHSHPRSAHRCVAHPSERRAEHDHEHLDALHVTGDRHHTVTVHENSAPVRSSPHSVALHSAAYSEQSSNLVTKGASLLYHHHHHHRSHSVHCALVRDAADGDRGQCTFRCEYQSVAIAGSVDARYQWP